MAKLINTREAAKIVGVSYLTMRRYVLAGKIRVAERNLITGYMWFDVEKLKEDIQKLILDKPV
jgi:predicted site-specific integrase-resolvase